ncbi:MAG: hypothetical protein AUJ92_17930 [Armatimonadetes bacterium CG2_30_59_28]|nr:aldolase [Armatimonadota bacterium]OIO90786.1 MAG: hypothetical protein AUJ92_17930 [Armatimonadetes bacterium CG2_30_59_28]PIU67533.1 MAG: aldolase [Armatimonadetes bacterium CG07_land_8_20_14_0_80_59_28]PIX45114.1 MAG: aldolase [Armatimonadetes bacterium CG_4_8_14_3_um_filter_58_9]PIY40233.1 MAG: aldolase [Armatimonadetes bacterium CG_4_10_14_3_um_filter_59_10]PJB75844.1 MAG: aldolase [Armatimonadetes bacterium CG_4_9_14_3_um_filter_58_7]
MSIGKQVRLNRLFSHPSGKLCSIAIDHFFNYADDTSGMPEPLRHISRTLAEVAEGRPDAITLQRGIVASLWEPYAGRIPLILQCSVIRPDDSVNEQIADPEDAVRLGADAFAIAAFVRGETQGKQLKAVADHVKKAERYAMPVIVHIYPRRFGERVEFSFEPDDIAWAVRCALECGVDVIKTPFCGDASAFRQIVDNCPIPIVVAGGPKTNSLGDFLAMIRAAIDNGAAGTTAGRNVWGAGHTTQSLIALKAVVHQGLTPGAALCKGNLQ